MVWLGAVLAVFLNAASASILTLSASLRELNATSSALRRSQPCAARCIPSTLTPFGTCLRAMRWSHLPATTSPLLLNQNARDARCVFSFIVMVLLVLVFRVNVRHGHASPVPLASSGFRALYWPYRMTATTAQVFSCLLVSCTLCPLYASACDLHPFGKPLRCAHIRLLSYPTTCRSRV